MPQTVRLWVEFADGLDFSSTTCQVCFMITAELLDCGWSRDLPDHRDYTGRHRLVRKLLAGLNPAKGKESRPQRVDWREYCAPVEDQRQLPTGPSHACIGLIQYFERRASGRMLKASRLFLHANALRLAGGNGSQSGVSLRTTFKAALKFGLPPERYWPYDPSAIDQTPEPFAYGFDDEMQSARYIRLDDASQTGPETLAIVKSFVSAGFACSLGFGVPSSLSNDPEIPYPTLYDSILTGQAVTVVGYDDALRIRSEKGALLVRNSWGAKWGADGYGWLPYRFVTDRLAADIWTLLKPKWLKSGEFRRPI